jgi:DNA-binding MarR family transcriptional regulator
MPNPSATLSESAPAGSLGDELFFVMARASAIGSSHANRALSTLGLKVREYSALVLACSDEAPTQRELSRHLALDPSQIVAIVDTLEKRDLVERRPDPRDRRSKIVVATKAGRALSEKARALSQASDEESLTMLTADERATLHALLTKVAFA